MIEQLKQNSWLTIYHPEFKQVSSATRAVFVGDSIIGLTHRCGSPTKTHKLRMMCPTHYSRGTCYCYACDTLFVQGYEEDLGK